MNSYRIAMTVLASLSLAMNATLAMQGYRYRRVISMPLVFMFYTATAACTNGVSVYFRLRDGVTDAPFNPGDITVIIPTLGFLTASVLGLRALAHRLESQRLSDAIDLTVRAPTARTRSTDTP